MHQTFIKNKPKMKRNTYSQIKNVLKKHKPKTLVLNFGQVDTGFSYFYNKIYGVPYNVKCIIYEYISIIKCLQKYVKKVYVINFLPLFVDTAKNLYTEFKLVHVSELFEKLTKKQLNDIYNIKKYRAHLINANNILKKELKRHCPLVEFIDFNKHIYTKNKNFKKKFYMKCKKSYNRASVPIDMHICMKPYITELFKNYKIDNLDKKYFKI